jgi:hypothetical protein
MVYPVTQCTDVTNISSVLKISQYTYKCNFVYTHKQNYCQVLTKLQALIPMYRSLIPNLTKIRQ